MKKILLSLAIAALSLPAFADELNLVFTTSDGSTWPIAASSLEIKFVDGNMVATNGSESLTLSVASLSSMKFASKAAGVAEESVAVDGEVSVTGINGVGFGSFQSADEACSNLAPGVYLLKHKSGEVSKIIVRK